MDDSQKITRNDIADKLKDITGESRPGDSSLLKTAVTAAAGALIIAAYLIGRFKFSKKRTIVEIKRI